MKVLLTGAAGRLGRSIIAGAPSDAAVEALLSPTGGLVPGVPWYRTDIADRDRTIMAVTCADPDVVVHCAAFTDVDGCEADPDRAFSINRDGTETIARACAECGAKMVYISTDHVFDGISGPYAESDQPRPVNVYGRSKLEGEEAAARHVEGLTVVRVAVLFGKRLEGVKHNFLSWLVDRFRSGNAVRAWSDQMTTPAYLDELSETLWALILRGQNGVFHYGTSDRQSRSDMALEVCRVLGFPEDLVEPVKFADTAMKAPRPMESGFITDKVHEVLGRPPVTFAGALERIVEGHGI